MHSMIAVAGSALVFQRLRLSSSICIEDQKLSLMALSSRSPTLPDEGRAGGADLLPEDPGDEPAAVVGVDDAAGFGPAIAEGRAEGVDHERGVLAGPMDQPTILRLSASSTAARTAVPPGAG